MHNCLADPGWAIMGGKNQQSLWGSTLDKLFYLWLTLTPSLTRVRNLSHNLKCSSAHTQDELVMSGLAFPCQTVARVPKLKSLLSYYHHFHSVKENSANIKMGREKWVHQREWEWGWGWGLNNSRKPRAEWPAYSKIAAMQYPAIHREWELGI